MPCPARPARKVLRVEQVNDSRQNGIGQFALHQPVAKFEDGVLFKHVSIEIELGKLAAPRHVKEGFLHFRVRQAKPLPEKVNARHGFQGKGWAILTILGCTEQQVPPAKPTHLHASFTQETRTCVGFHH